MALDKYEICSRALVRVGGKRITSFEGIGAEAVTAYTLYESAVRALLSKYRWRFSSRQIVLTREATPGDARWSARYLIPAETLNIHAVTIRDAPIEFDRYENWIFCDAHDTDVLTLDFTYRSEEAYWPGYFDTTLELRLASDFAVPIADDIEKASYYQQLFRLEFAVAKAMDSQGRTARKLPVGRFAAFMGGRP